MNGTPRLRSAFPQSPQTLGRDRRRQTESPAIKRPQNVSVTTGPRPAQPGQGPLIPTDVIDAPSQRFYVAALYIALGAWRIYDSMGAANELDSTWLFLKWNFIDGVFLFGIQTLRVPWLEWTFPTFLTIFLLHAATNVFLMFRIPLPLGAWGGILYKSFYDREMSISGGRVKPGDILHNASLILGKQIIHILPEGSAALNPDGIPLCLNPQQTSVTLPIRVNQSTPILIDIIRYDISTGQNETISISHKQLKQMKKQAGEPAADGHLDLRFPIKKTGIYRLARVLDESKLEVQTRASDTLIPVCPRAVPKNTFSDKCKGDLSDITLEVEGVAPLKVKYSRRINGFDGGFSFQNVHAEGSLVPITGRKPAGILIDPKQPDPPSWAQTANLRIALNETLDAGGEWLYTIEEVHDAQGNVANYSSYLDETDRASLKNVLQSQQFLVHERPRLSMVGCNAQKFLQTAKGETTELPLHFHSSGRDYSDDAPFQLTYSYSPEEADGQTDVAKILQVSLKTSENRPKTKEPGWYSLESVSSRFCRGEILEPSSCLLHNPPEPDLSIRHEKLFDKCANSSVGLLVDLDMIGSPPFRLRYVIESDKGTETFSEVIKGLRGQLDFTPTQAGLYRYRFLDIADSVYGPRPLKDKVQVLEQDVKPQASAHLLGTHKPQRTCFGESATVGVSFIGEAPWTLQYEVVHNGKKTKYEIESYESVATIVTEPLYSGGEHIISLTGVTDRTGCKRALKDSAVVHVRPKKPQAAFGFIEEKRTTQALEGNTVLLPLRLSGQSPWIVKYRNLDANAARLFEKKIWDENGAIPVTQNGVYELVEVFDSTCPGNIEQSASTFEIKWLPRPALSVSGRTGVGENVSKRSVCHGDDDILELKLEGKAPFNVKYEHHRDHGSVKTRNLKSTSNVASLELDTSKPGNHVYKFTAISDALYDADPKAQSPVSISQTVNALPSARFETPGHIYAFCKEDSDGDELIPIVLEGQPPFYLDISIKHHSSAKPEVVPVGPIHSHKHKLPIPRRHLELGQHVVSIHRVGDSLGCQRTFEKDLSSVRVAVSDVPTIIPLESQTDYCVGERLSFSLSGHAPFDVFYTFEGVKRKASSQSTTFRRIAEKPGVFTITAVSDGASGRCQAHKNITKVIHEMPSVRISRGRESIIDIHEGGEAEINFEFGGTPPFEFTYTRSSNARKGKPAEILDIKHDISYEYKKTIKTSDEGTYEVVAIKDKYCSFSTQKASAKIAKQQTKKLITN